MLHLRKAQGGNVSATVSQFAPEMGRVACHVPELPTISQPEIDAARRPSWVAQNFVRTPDDIDANALLGDSATGSDCGLHREDTSSFGAPSGESLTHDEMLEIEEVSCAAGYCQ